MALMLVTVRGVLAEDLAIVRGMQSCQRHKSNVRFLYTKTVHQQNLLNHQQRGHLWEVEAAHQTGVLIWF